MKKGLIVSCFVFAIVLFCSFTTTSTDRVNSDNGVTISQPDLRSVHVCKITGTSTVVTNFSFTGQYDSDNNYIWIYNQRKQEVAKGKVQVNNNKKGKRGDYSYCLNDTYYFNL